MVKILVAGNREIIRNWMYDNHPELNPNLPGRNGFHYCWPGKVDAVRGLLLESEDDIICLRDWDAISVREWDILRSRVRPRIKDRQ